MGKKTSTAPTESKDSKPKSLDEFMAKVSTSKKTSQKSGKGKNGKSVASPILSNRTPSLHTIHHHCTPYKAHQFNSNSLPTLIITLYLTFIITPYPTLNITLHRILIVNPHATPATFRIQHSSSFYLPLSSSLHTLPSSSLYILPLPVHALPSTTPQTQPFTTPAQTSSSKLWMIISIFCCFYSR